MSRGTRSSRRQRNKPPLEAEIKLEAWGAKGYCVGKLEERTVSIDRGVPGETVAATVDRRQSPWRGIAHTILLPSADRIAPPCPHYAQGCGGCQWQHLDYSAQLKHKRNQVDGEMERRGVRRRVDDVHAMENPWRYRRTAAIAIGWEAGFRPRGRRGIVEVRDCPISHPYIGFLSDALNDVLREGGIPNYHGKVWIDCTVVDAEGRQCLQLVIQGIEGLTPETHPELAGIAELLISLPHVGSVSYRHRSGEVIALRGELHGRVKVCGTDLHLPAGAFFQSNVAMLERLLGRMSALLENTERGQAADIYGGVGTFGICLARHFNQVTLIELDGQAVEAARETTKEMAMTNVSFVARHAEFALPDLGALHVAIVDPPRSGLGATVVGALANNGVPLILYVSCSPTSLAVDLADFQSRGYSVTSLEIFDFYPQTFHVECLAVLQR